MAYIAYMLSRAKNVSTGAVIPAKRGRELSYSVHKLLAKLANYQTGGYKFMPMNDRLERTNRIA